MSATSHVREQLQAHLAECYGDVDPQLDAVRAHLDPFCDGEVSFEVTDLIAEERHTLVVRGQVRRGGEAGGVLTVRYMPDIGVIDMSGLVVERPDRGSGIAASFALRLLYSARSLEYGRILIEAGPTMGRAIWARYGFSFASRAAQERVRSWFEEKLPALGCSPPMLEGVESPAEFYAVGVGEPCERTIGEIANLVGYEGLDRDDVIAANLGIEDLHVGHALLLFGPDWDGVLRVESQAAIRFEAACKRRLRAIGAQVPSDFGR